MRCRGASPAVPRPREYIRRARAPRTSASSIRSTERDEMTNGDTWLVIIDMQNVFASGPITWRCPDFGKIIEPIRRLAADYPGRTLLTPFVDAPQKAGSWVQYYKESAFANVPESNCMYEIVTALQDLITADNVVTRTTFNKWDGILSKTAPCPHRLLPALRTAWCVPSRRCRPPMRERS